MIRFEQETIHIRRLRVECIIGVRPEEREHEQPLEITLSIAADFGPGAERDALAQTVDYSAVAAETRRFVRAGRFGLLETLARRLGSHLCGRFGLDEVRLEVVKPRAVSGSDGAAVSLTVKGQGRGEP